MRTKTLYYPVKVQSRNGNASRRQRSSEDHRDTGRSGDALRLSRWASYFSRNSCRKLYCCRGNVHVIRGHLPRYRTSLPFSMPTPTDLHRLDGSAPSVLPEDFDGLVLCQRHRETKQQAGGDWKGRKGQREAGMKPPERTGLGYRGGKAGFLLNPDLPRPP